MNFAHSQNYMNEALWLIVKTVVKTKNLRETSFKECLIGLGCGLENKKTPERINRNWGFVRGYVTNRTL